MARPTWPAQADPSPPSRGERSRPARVAGVDHPLDLTVVGSQPAAVDPVNGMLYPLGPGRPRPVQLPGVTGAPVQLTSSLAGHDVWLIRGGMLVSADPATGQTQSVALPAGDAYGAPVVNAGRVYVPDRTAGTVLIFDVDGVEPRRSGGGASRCTRFEPDRDRRPGRQGMGRQSDLPGRHAGQSRRIGRHPRQGDRQPGGRPQRAGPPAPPAPPATPPVTTPALSPSPTPLTSPVLPPVPTRLTPVPSVPSVPSVTTGRPPAPAGHPAAGAAHPQADGGPAHHGTSHPARPAVSQGPQADRPWAKRSLLCVAGDHTATDLRPPRPGPSAKRDDRRRGHGPKPGRGRLGVSGSPVTFDYYGSVAVPGFSGKSPGSLLRDGRQSRA